MMALAFATLASLGAVLVAAWCLLRVGRVAPVEPDSFIRGLAHSTTLAPDLTRVSEQMARAGCPMSKDGIPLTPALLIQDWNDHLGDIDGLLQGSAKVPFLAARVALFSGTFAAVLDVPQVLVGRVSSLSALTSFVVGVAGAAIAWELGGRLARRSDAIRRDWDRLGTVIAGLLPGAGSATRNPRRGKAASLPVPQ